MRRWPCVVVAMLCCMFAVATSASAEGAWVLREENALLGPPWRRLEVFGTEPECQTAALREARLTYDRESPKRHQVLPGSAELEGSRVHVPAEFEDWIISYVCLPDTVDMDPRGPKGK